MIVRFVLNGREVEARGLADTRLLDTLRRDFGLTGTKEGCGEGECGACTILLDGDAVLSCLLPLVQVDGREVYTVEALDADSRGAQFLERFAAAGGTQCGACTPGIVLSAAQYLGQAEEVNPEGIREALAGNICRCTGYEAILRAVLEEGRLEDRTSLTLDGGGPPPGSESS